MKLAAYEPSEWGGSFFYRAVSPLHTLPEWDTTFSQNFQKDADAAFFWLPKTDTEHKLIAEYAKCGVPVFLDFDDNVFELPEELPAAKLFTPVVCQKILQSIKLASLVTVSTLELKKQLHFTKAKIEVIPNAFDNEIFTHPSQGKRNKIVLWRGAGGHDLDLSTVMDELVFMAKTHPDWKFIFAGEAPPCSQKIPQSQRIDIPFEDINTYMKKCAELNAAIMIVPLHNNAHNEVKSNVSYLEGTYFGATVVAPPLPEFRMPGVVTYSGTEEFLSRMDWQMQRVGSEKLVGYARAYINERLSVGHISKLRAHVYNQVVDV